MSERFKVVDEWLSHCTENHPRCLETVEGFPSRILDLEDAERGYVLLVGTQNLLLEARPIYTTLSHCWGRKQPLRTSLSNLDRHEQAILLSDLPKTFADAVLITRRIQVRYLWIDSLCIVQDDRSDWENEAKLMAAIYQNSFLTISATSSPDCLGGCYTEDRDFGGASSLVKAADGQQYWVALRTPRKDFPKPLLDRGWVFQETILSQRIVHFTSDQMFWQCKGCFESEDGLVSVGDVDSPVPPCLQKSPQEFGFLGLFDEDLHRIKEGALWSAWVRRYSRLKFTFESDRIPAMAGMVQYYQSKGNIVQMLGIWSHTIAVDLAWHRPQEYGDKIATRGNRILPKRHHYLPTWSWLSVEGGVNNYFAKTRINNQAIEPHIVSWYDRWSGASYVSRLLDYRLEVSARILDITIHAPAESKPESKSKPKPKTKYTLYYNSRYNFYNGGTKLEFWPHRSDYWPDSGHIPSDGDILTGIVLFSMDTGLCFLSLRPAARVGEYERVGVGILEVGPSLTLPEAQVLTLV